MEKARQDMGFHTNVKSWSRFPEVELFGYSGCMPALFLDSVAFNKESTLALPRLYCHCDCPSEYVQCLYCSLIECRDIKKHVFILKQTLEGIPI